MHAKPKKYLGQNFLTDANIQNKLIKACSLKKTDTVLEIGPGRGEITSLLLKNSKKVIAVEIDKGLCQILRNKFSDNSGFCLINADILKLDLCGYHGLTVVANIPYYITSPIISRLFKYKKSFKYIYLTVQKEVALRIQAKPASKEYSSFSCFVQLHSNPKWLFTIKKTSFWPRPRVDSAFIKLGLLDRPRIRMKDEESFLQFIRNAFSQRRKQIKNTIFKNMPFAQINAIYKKYKISEEFRPEQLSLRDFANIYKILNK